MSQLNNAFTLFLSLLVEAMPFLLIGVLFSGLLLLFVDEGRLIAALPKNPFLGAVIGSCAGFFFPVCECGVVPVTRRLFKKGLPMSVGVAFLLAAPFMNPIVFASTFIAFGFGDVFILRFIVTAVVAISVGLIFALTARPEEALQPASMMATDAFDAVVPRKGFKQGIAQASGIAVNEFFEMGRFLIIGCLMAAAMQTFIPQSTLTVVGGDPLISVLAMQALAFILSICSTVDSFLALAFVNTFTTGAIVAFLSFGPMVDIKSTMMFMGVFKRRAVGYLILLPFVMNLLAGVLINVRMGYF